MKELDDAFEQIIELNVKYSRFKDIGIDDQELVDLVFAFYQKKLKAIVDELKAPKVK